MSEYDDMTDEDFDRLLAEVMDRDNPRPSSLLTIPGIYEVLAEHYNNDVLTAWDEERAAEQQDDDKG